MKTVTAIAHPNIALVKYWGKRDPTLNLPATHSLSYTLDTLFSRTRLCFRPDLSKDRILYRGHPADLRFAARIQTALENFRQQAGVTACAEVDTSNNFPTAAGLASSASGFAALLTAANAAIGKPLEIPQLALLCRQASGSAARSLFSGFVLQHRGQRQDGSDALAEQLHPAGYWPLEVVIAITESRQKHTPSSDGMTHTAATSPYWDAWLTRSDPDITAARQAIKERDFEKLAEIAEGSCLAMHAMMLAARPALCYWNPATVALIEAIGKLRRRGFAVFFSIDAGPQVKAFCLPESAVAVRKELESVPGVERCIHCAGGDGAHVLASEEVDV